MSNITSKITKLTGGLLLLLLSSCHIVLTDERGDALQQYDYYVDANGMEGIVLSVGSSSCVVLSLEEVERTWGPLNETVYQDVRKDDEDKSSYSLSMLYIMQAHGMEHYPAQAWCASLNHGAQYGLGCWRLPSYYDWEKLIRTDDATRLKKLNEAIVLYGGTPLNSGEFYWTSTEDYEGVFVFADPNREYDYDSANRAIAVSPRLTALVNKDYWVKSYVHKVRAIKYVYYKK